MSILSEYLCNRCHLLSRDEKLNFVKLSDEEVKERVDKYILNLETELRHESKMMSFKDERASALMSVGWTSRASWNSKQRVNAAITAKVKN